MGLTLAPQAATPVAAATGRLLLTAAATYTVDPATATVRVSVAATYVNDKPSDNDFFYYWRDLAWPVHPEATNLRVSDGSGALSVKPVVEDGFVEAQFRLRRNLLYRQSVKLTIAWDLPGGAPRSESSIRVGESFVTFDLWAWGDPGTSSVTAALPGGYEVETFGSTVAQTSAATGVTIRANAIGNTDEFWTSVTAIREAGFATDELTLPGGIELVVRAWPEDTEWRTKVRTMLRDGIPALSELIGLPWPIERPVEVTEVYTPLLEGYAGIFYTLEDRIDISEDLDTLVIVHEASHAWFNDRLFKDRWIDEGLADTYAAAVLLELGEGRQSPDTPAANDDGRTALQTWGDPGRITDATEAIERYGYNTSWYVVEQIFEEIGPQKMRAIFQAAEDDVIAYQGAGDDEPVTGADGWHRFLDLLEEIGGSEKADELFREYVVTNIGSREMDDRAVRREDYANLLAEGDEWLPPIYVREVMGSWAFPKAEVRIDEARAILTLRDEVTAAADALEVTPGPAFEEAYETAEVNFDDAEAAGEAELDALATLAEASATVSAPLDFVAAVGLLDVEPMAAYEEATTAYESGRLEDATEAAAAAVALVAEGPRIGRERLALAGGIAGLALLVGLLLVRRRRRARRTAALALAVGTVGAVVAGEAVAAGEAGGAGGAGPYGTLAADSPAPPPPTDGDAGPEGGAADGEGPGAAT
jgi:hypothetical protein